jgi:hypothetical protein
MDASIGFELIAKSITVIVSVFIAATLAMSNLKKKQNIDDENEKFKNTITLLVCASRCHSNLSSAWNTLSNIKESHGHFRGLNVTTGGVVEKVDEGLVFNLYWLPSEMDASTTDGLGFRNLAYIQHMFEKYNQWVKLYGELGELKKVINIELSEASNVKGFDF